MINKLLNDGIKKSSLNITLQDVILQWEKASYIATKMLRTEIKMGHRTRRHRIPIHLSLYPKFLLAQPTRYCIS
jgi:hypothetical protein